MARFALSRDIKFFESISRELVDVVIETAVVLYKLVIEDSKTNLYGESLDKSYYQGVSLFCMVEYGDESQQYDGFGQDTVQEVIFKFNQDTCIKKDVMPEIGDIIQFAEGYYEITNTNQTQLVGMQANNNFTVECITYLTRRSQLNIEERNR